MRLLPELSVERALQRAPDPASRRPSFRTRRASARRRCLSRSAKSMGSTTGLEVRPITDAALQEMDPGQITKQTYLLTLRRVLLRFLGWLTGAVPARPCFGYADARTEPPRGFVSGNVGVSNHTHRGLARCELYQEMGDQLGNRLRERTLGHWLATHSHSDGARAALLTQAKLSQREVRAALGLLWNKVRRARAPT